MRELTHFDEEGKARMVDVSEKDVTKRVAKAGGRIIVGREIFERIKEGTVEKGDVLGIARVAGIMAMKKTSDLIPLCHPLPVTGSSIDFTLEEEGYSVYCEAVCKVTGKTGVEMEALTGVSVALLTIYDMCKALSRDMVLGDIGLLEKSGGKSGDYKK